MINKVVKKYYNAKNPAEKVDRIFCFGAEAGVEPARVISPTDFELFASHGIQTNSTPHGGH